MAAGGNRRGPRERIKRTKLGVSGVNVIPEKSDLVGKIALGRYSIGEELGAGAMGSVFHGRHLKLGSDVAIKVMHERHAGEPVLLERFRREGQLAARLNHPNVVAVIDVGEMPDHKPVMVMEYAKGTPLGDLMTAPLPGERVASYVAQLLRGLDHAHRAGLVHRDLKPDNVIVTIDADGSERLRIVDFGIAVLTGGDEDQGGRLTATGMIVGTPLYMAPEQAKGEPLDHRADLYALGVIVYEMLSGLAPFEGSAMEVAVAKVDRDPPPISVRAPDVVVDRVLTAFMRKLLARDPEQRFATAEVALDLLDLYLVDRLAAASALGVIDVERALALITLPDPPPSQR